MGGSRRRQRLDQELAGRTRRSTSSRELAHTRQLLTARKTRRPSRRLVREAVWSATSVGLALVNEGGEYVSVNDALCRVLGRAEAEMVGQTSAPFTHPEDGHVQGRAQVRSTDGAVEQRAREALRPAERRGPVDAGHDDSCQRPGGRSGR